MELLPNEILLQCFEYLDRWNIFQGFYQLNSRFNALIEMLLIDLNFHQISKAKFVQYCMIIDSNPEIKQCIYSIELSNEYLYDQIELFFSWFSLNEFPYLQRLSFTKITDDNLIKLQSILPTLSELIDFRLIKCEHNALELLSIIPMSKLCRLYAPMSSDNVKPLYELSSIKHLTLYKCDLYVICEILSNVPLLKYLELQEVYRNSSQQWTRTLKTCKHTQLKELIMTNFQFSFINLEFFLSQLTNLQYLKITSYSEEIVDAPRWESLIKTSLHRLTVFNFEFICRCYYNIFDKFQQFQSDFWCKQHQWDVDYGRNEQFLVIHTIPYIHNDYILEKSSIKYQLNKSNKFTNVKRLSIYYKQITNQCEYYFPNVTSLTLRREFGSDNLSKDQLLKYLPMIVNLSNLDHLEIIDHSAENVTLILYEVLKKASRLSSLGISVANMKLLLKNDEVCQYLNTMIKKLDDHYYSLNTFNEIEIFCQIFSNLQQFKYNVCEQKFLLYLLNHLSHLLVLEICLSKSTNCENLLCWLNEQTLGLNMTFHIEEIAKTQSLLNYYTGTNFSISIERKRNQI